VIAFAPKFDRNGLLFVRVGMPDCLLATGRLVEYLRENSAPGAPTDVVYAGIPVHVCDHLPPGVLGQVWKDGLVVFTIREGDQ